MVTIFKFYCVIDELQTDPSFPKKGNILRTTMATKLKFGNDKYY